MKLLANQSGLFQVHRSATPVFLGAQRVVPVGRRSMRVSGRSCCSLSVCAGGFLSRAHASVATQFRPALLATPFGLASALAQRLVASPVVRVAQAASRHLRSFSVVLVSRFELQSHAEKTAPSSSQCSNPALNPVRFALWTRRDKAAPRRLALR